MYTHTNRDTSDNTMLQYVSNDNTLYNDHGSDYFAYT